MNYNPLHRYDDHGPVMITCPECKKTALVVRPGDKAFCYECSFCVRTSGGTSEARRHASFYRRQLEEEVLAYRQKYGLLKK